MHKILNFLAAENERMEKALENGRLSSDKISFGSKLQT